MSRQEDIDCFFMWKSQRSHGGLEADFHVVPSSLVSIDTAYFYKQTWGILHSRPTASRTRADQSVQAPVRDMGPLNSSSAMNNKILLIADAAIQSWPAAQSDQRRWTWHFPTTKRSMRSLRDDDTAVAFQSKHPKPSSCMKLIYLGITINQTNQSGQE